MNYSTYAALTNYATVAAALAANPSNGSAWLLNETKVFQDARMGNARSANIDENTYKKGAQRQLARTLTPTIQRNRGNVSGVKTTAIGGTYPDGSTRNLTYNTSTGGAKLSTPGGGTFVNRETVANTKGPAIRHKVSWYVTDTSLAAGYRRVFGILEDSATTNAGRDDDSQVRL